MRSLDCASRFPNLQHHRYYQLLPLPLVSASFRNKSSQSFNTSLLVHKCNGIGLRPPCALPESGHSESLVHGDEDKDVDGSKQQEKQEEVRTATTTAVTEEANSATIISSCLVGLLTGVAVVVFNNAVRHLLPSLRFSFFFLKKNLTYTLLTYCINLLKLMLEKINLMDWLIKVHEIRDFFWDGIPSRGASWLREKPTQEIWMQVILVPACGGLIVSFLNLLRNAPALQVDQDSSPPPPVPAISFSLLDNVKSALRPFLKALAACVTLGTGNSLGPEGPSVEIGTSIAKGVRTLFDKNSHRNLSLLAAGSAAGISSGWSLLLLSTMFIHHHGNILKFVYLLPFRLWFGKYHNVMACANCFAWRRYFY